MTRTPPYVTFFVMLAVCIVAAVALTCYDLSTMHIEPNVYRLTLQRNGHYGEQLLSSSEVAYIFSFSSGVAEPINFTPAITAQQAIDSLQRIHTTDFKVDKSMAHLAIFVNKQVETVTLCWRVHLTHRFADTEFHIIDETEYIDANSGQSIWYEGEEITTGEFFYA